MNEKPTANPRMPFGVFFGVFIFVFTIVLGLTILDTTLAPKTYMSTARVEVKYKQDAGKQTRPEKRIYDLTLAKTEAEVIGSEVILRKVIANLNLNQALGKKYLDGLPLKTRETLQFLQGRTSIHPVPDTTLIQIQVFDQSPDDAAIFANGIAKAYTTYVATNRSELQAQIIDSAYADKIQVRPNKTLNYFFGIVVGIFLGLMAGAGIALFVFLKNRKAFQISES